MHTHYAIVSQIRNKAVRIKDWVRYHSSEGFDTFVIFDDNSTDYTMRIFDEMSKECNINLHIFKTTGPFNRDGKELEVGVGEYLNSEHVTSISLADRICESFTRGFRFLKETYPNTVCAFIDDDEFLVTEKDKKVVEVIDEIFEDRKLEWEQIRRSNSEIKTKNLSWNLKKIVGDRYREQLLIQSFDVKDQYRLREWYTADERANQIWDTNSLHENRTWRNRSKCIIRTDSVGEKESCRSMHSILHPTKDSKFIKSLKNVSIVADEGDFVRDYSKLRIFHFRKPQQQGFGSEDIKFTTNDTLLNKMKKIRG